MRGSWSWCGPGSLLLLRTASAGAGLFIPTPGTCREALRPPPWCSVAMWQLGLPRVGQPPCVILASPTASIPKRPRAAIVDGVEGGGWGKR